MRVFARIIGYGLALLLVAAAIGFVYKYTNGFNEDFKTFYIEYGSRQILTTENKMTLKSNDIHHFDVKYTFDKEGDEPKDYKLKIIPNMTRDFDYSVDGENYRFSKLGDLTDVFDLEKGDTYFELYLHAGTTFGEVLRMAQGGSKVIVSKSALMNNPYPFRIQVSSYNGSITYNIDFTIDDIEYSKDDIPWSDKPADPPDDFLPPDLATPYLIGWQSKSDENGFTVG